MMSIGLARVLLLSLCLGLGLALGLGGRAEARQVCAWLVEKAEKEDLHQFDLWLQADTRMDFFYKIGGTGVTGDRFRAHSPNTGTYLLEPGKAERPWGVGTTMPSHAKIDITIELHQTPTNIFSDAPTPLIVAFSFARTVPASEKKVPAALAAKQCKPVP